MALPTRILGRTGAEVTVLGLGGEGVLRTHGRFREAAELVRKALDLGITYFESARAYAGSEEYLGRSLGPDRQRVFLATKSHARRARAARAHLDESLALLRTEWVDLWFVHDVRSEDDLAVLGGPGGALEVFQKAREQGEVRFVGISGHHSPRLLLRALKLFDFDCVLCPVNPAETGPGGFGATVVAEAARRNLGVVAMKTLFRGLAVQVPGAPEAGMFLRYAAGVPGVHVLSVGCDDPAQLERNAGALESPEPMSSPERGFLERLVEPYARRLAYYRPLGSHGAR